MVPVIIITTRNGVVLVVLAAALVAEYKLRDSQVSDRGNNSFPQALNYT